MKIENYEGIEYVVLDKNDKIRITTSSHYQYVQLKENNNKLDIIGAPDIINSIKGNGILEKVYIDPVLTKDEILKKCDLWFDMFKKTHDKFKELVLSDEFKKDDIRMVLTFPSALYSLDNVHCSEITINLERAFFCDPVKKGVSIAVNDDNIDVYNYLVARVLDYYITQNYGNKKIYACDFFKGELPETSRLYSDIEKDDDRTFSPIIANLGNLREKPELDRLVNRIINAHDIGMNGEQIIDELKSCIFDQKIGDYIDESIEESSRELKHL